jgi:hypothetical protein
MGMVRCERCRFSFEHTGPADVMPECRQCGGRTEALTQPAAPATEVGPSEGKTRKLAVIPPPK